MKFLVISKADGKRRVGEHDCMSFEELNEKLEGSEI